MYEALTALIPELKKGSAGKWAEQTGNGTAESPYTFPFVVYGKQIHDLEDEVYRFVESHPEMNLRAYDRVLNEYNIEWDFASMKKACTSMLDGKAVMALLLGAIRAERFCDGALLDFCKSGCILRWLERLDEIDKSAR